MWLLLPYTNPLIRSYFNILSQISRKNNRNMPEIVKKTTDSQWPYADNTFLPLRRRRARTLRPFAELMRSRKPCTLLRLRLFG